MLLLLPLRPCITIIIGIIIILSLPGLHRCLLLLGLSEKEVQELVTSGLMQKRLCLASSEGRLSSQR